MKTKKTELEKFKSEYGKLTGKYGFDFRSTIVCNSKFTEWIVHRLKVVATMQIIEK